MADSDPATVPRVIDDNWDNDAVLVAVVPKKPSLLSTSSVVTVKACEESNLTCPTASTPVLASWPTIIVLAASDKAVAPLVTDVIVANVFTDVTDPPEPVA